MLIRFEKIARNNGSTVWGVTIDGNAVGYTRRKSNGEWVFGRTTRNGVIEYNRSHTHRIDAALALPTLTHSF